MPPDGQGRLRWEGGRGQLPLLPLSKDVVILVQRCLTCILNRNLAPLPSVRAGVPADGYGPNANTVHVLPSTARD